MKNTVRQDANHQDPKKSFFDRLLDFGKIIGMAMIFLSFAGICWHVFMRYLFQMPINWFIDVSTLFMFYLTFLGSAWLLREKGHVSLDFLRHAIGLKKYLRVEKGINILCGIACLVIVYYGIMETILSIKLETIVDMPLGPPKWTVLFMIPAGFLLLAIEFFRQVLNRNKRAEELD